MRADLKVKTVFLRCFSWSFNTSNVPIWWSRILHSDDRDRSHYLIVIIILQPCQMRCPISSPVVNQFKYKICDTCLMYVDLIHTHVLHLIQLWTLVHLMSQYVIRIGYVHLSNKTPFISWKKNMNILINKEFNHFIISILMDWDHKTNNLPLGLNASQGCISCPSHQHAAQKDW